MNADAFLETLKDELLDASEIGDVSGVSERLAELRDAMDDLESVRDAKGYVEFLGAPGAYKLAGLLLGTAPRWLEGRPKSTVADQISRWREWVHQGTLKGLVSGLLLSEAQRSRAPRRRRKFEKIVKNNLSDQLKRLPRQLELRSAVRLSMETAARTFDLAIYDDGRPLVAVVDIFQTRAGGRQQDIFLGLPDLQDRLTREGIVLFVIADGPGFASMGQIVRRVAPQLDHFVNLSELDNGEELTLALKRATALREGLPTSSRTAREDILWRTTTLALRSGRTVDKAVLGLAAEKEADALLLRYDAAHPQYALVRREPGTLEPEASQQLKELRRMLDSTERGNQDAAAEVPRLLANRLGYPIKEFETDSRVRLFGLSTPGLRLRLPVPLPIFVFTSRRSPTESFEIIDAALSGGDLVARLALLFDPFDPKASREAAKELASQRRSQIAVLDSTDAAEILLNLRSDALQYLTHVIIRDVDLSLVSPFVSEGPTPNEMFFGRESEIRQIVEQIRSQSFALVGGRKVGKTSLLQRLRQTVTDRGPVLYVDCQAHPDREDFLRYLESLTENGSPTEEKPRAPEAERVIRSLLASRFGKEFGILLLDEVDELFHSDSHAASYTHVLSRALRAVSQSSTATLVATGERALFELTRDPSSPHWNFCTPIIIGPLSDDAAERLLAEPLAVLGIEVTSDALDSAILQTARHPNLLQYLGSCLVELLSPVAKKGEPLTAAADHIQSLTSSLDFRNRFIRTFWSQATPLERLISLYLSCGTPKSSDEMIAVLRRDGITTPASEVEKALEFLELYSIARPEKHGYVYRSEAFEVHFGPLASTAIAREWRDELRRT